MNDDRKPWIGRAANALIGWRDDLADRRRSGDLAALGRLALPRDAMLLPCFAELVNRACETDTLDSRRLDALARCAFLAGRLFKFEDGAKLGELMAKRRGSKRPLISPVRAVALFSLEEADQACMAIASLLAQMGGRQSARLDPLEIMKAMNDWDSMRRGIALAYHRSNSSLATASSEAA